MLKAYLKELINNKKVLILGFGREGKSSYRLIKEVSGYSSLAISDKNGADGVEEKVYSGEDYQKAIANYDIIFKSPGVVLTEKTNGKIISQTDIMIHCFKNRFVGITGTKGKSTTTTLIYHILKECGKNAVLMGNIGIPAFDALEELDDSSILVYELSCHQLEYAVESPHIGVLLNIYPEHLDHYGTFEKYKAAKQNIYKNMIKGDLLVCGSEVKPSDFVAEAFTVSTTDTSANCFVSEDGSNFASETIDFSKHTKALFGTHNMYNISIAYKVCQKLGIEKDSFLKALSTFNSLSHRLELFAEIDGVRYFDDSISTIPETAVQAVKSIKNVGTLILGGMDRGISYDYLIDFIINSNIPRIILMPDTGIRIKKALDGKTKTELLPVSNLAEAASLAKKITKSGEACVLSPAAASYGFFKNFEERGDEFKRLIKGN